MQEKKSFYEIVSKNLEGKWCDGLVMLDFSDKEVTVNNIYSANGKDISINDYPIPLHEKVFSKVYETDYEKAISEFNTNNKDIISPKISTDEIITFDGCRSIQYGGNVYSHTQDGKIIVNDKHYFDNFDEIISDGFLDKKEIQGIWLIF